MFKKIDQKILRNLLILLIVFIIGLGFGREYLSKIPTQGLQTEKNTPKAFASEIYDKIKENYWNNISDAELLDLFKLSIEKNGGNVTVTKLENKDKFWEAIEKATAGMSEEKRNNFLVSVAGSVLASLNPQGRSGLYTEKQEEQLKNTVENRNPTTGKVEPTVFAKIVSPGILYVEFKKFSPTSLEEFQKAFDAYKDTPGVSTLIFDLRGNVGGAIDATTYFLGFFLGKGQYAFDFYHKGEYLPFKTATDKLPSISKYKQIAILVNQNTQSSAEMMAASLKKYHAGILIGTPTKGWGTVERVFPLENQISKKEKYSLFLVHSITLRDDNLPIEGRGVEPDISIKDPDWPSKLLLYFNNPALVDAVKKVL